MINGWGLLLLFLRFIQIIFFAVVVRFHAGSLPTPTTRTLCYTKISSTFSDTSLYVLMELVDGFEPPTF